MKTLFQEQGLRLAMVLLTLLAGGVFVIASFLIAEHERVTVAALESQLIVTTQRLQTLAVALDRDGGNELTAAVIHDCAPVQRQRFDELLSNLATLRSVELREVRTLYDACGDFYVNQRALMFMQLEREFESYAQFVALLQPFDGRSEIIVYPIEAWERLVELESARLDLMQELVVIQSDIIDQRTVSTEDTIATLVTKAQEVKNALSSLGTEIDEIRGTVQ